MLPRVGSPQGIAVKTVYRLSPFVNMPNDSGFAALAIAHPRFQRTPANRGVGGHVCMHIHANECVVGILQQCAT